MTEKRRDYKVDGKCTAVTYAEDCMCTRSVVFGMFGCVFWDDGECKASKKCETTQKLHSD